MRHQESHLQAQRPRLGQREAVHPLGDPLDLPRADVAGPPHRGVEPVAQRPQDGPVDEVQGEGDAAQVLAEARLEEAPQPGRSRDRGDEEGGREEEVEPLVVVGGLGLEQRQVVPPAVPAEELDLCRLGGDAAQVDGYDEEVVVDELLVGTEPREEPRQLSLGRQQVQVCEEHPHHEQAAVPPVADVHEVVHQADSAPKPGFCGRARQRKQARIHHDGPLHLDGYTPQVEVIRQPRLAARVEDEAEVLQLRVPPPDLVAHAALLGDVGDPQPAKGVPGEHEQEGRRDERDVEAQPAAEERGAQVVGQLGLLAGLDEAQGLCRQDVAGDDEERRDGEVAAVEEDPNSMETGEVVVALEAECVLEDAHLLKRVGPELMVLPIHEESSKPSQAI